MQNQKQGSVVSVQIMPYVEDHAAYDSPHFITEQPNGPTAYTSGFFIQLRHEIGPMKLVAATPKEEEAHFVAQAFAAHHGVEVEPQPWKKQ